jgi:hypothetical protein
MSTQDAISAVTVLFIVGMIWLRTRMQYTGRTRGRLQLQRSGKIYFAAALGVLVLGWLFAPALGRAMWPDPNATPTLLRVVWFLATYYAFILVHRALKARGVEVFKSAAGDRAP